MICPVALLIFDNGSNACFYIYSIVVVVVCVLSVLHLFDSALHICVCMFV